MDGYLTRNQFRNTCQSVISARTDWMVDFLTPVRNIASDYKMVTEMKQKEKKVYDVMQNNMIVENTKAY